MALNQWLIVRIVSPAFYVGYKSCNMTDEIGELYIYIIFQIWIRPNAWFQFLCLRCQTHLHVRSKHFVGIQKMLYIACWRINHIYRKRCTKHKMLVVFWKNLNQTIFAEFTTLKEKKSWIFDLHVMQRIVLLTSKCAALGLWLVWQARFWLYLLPDCRLKGRKKKRIEKL